MDLSHTRTVKFVAVLLLLAAISQAIYTALYVGAPEFDRKFIWGLEGLLFVLLAAFAGSALVRANTYTLGFSAIAFAALLNVMVVGMGLTQFGPFTQAAEADPALSSIAASVIGFSFFLYNAAKILLCLATVLFGMAKVSEGGRVLGGVTVLIGAAGFAANTFVMMFGLESLLPSPVAGASGVLATLLLALCLLRIRSSE